MTANNSLIRAESCGICGDRKLEGVSHRQLSQIEKRERIREAIRRQHNERGRASIKGISRRTGASKNTVKAILDQMIAEGEIDPTPYDDRRGQIDPPEPRKKLGDEFYTPPHAIKSLLQRESFDGSTIEPACGDGRIVRMMREAGLDCHGSDIKTGEAPEGCTYGVDYRDIAERYDNVVTNPPYSDLTNFVEHAKILARRKVAILAEVGTILTSRERYERVWQDRDFALARIWVLPMVVMFDRPDGGVFSAQYHRHGWFIFERGYQGKPTVELIHPDESKI